MENRGWGTFNNEQFPATVLKEGGVGLLVLNAIHVVIRTGLNDANTRFESRNGRKGNGGKIASCRAMVTNHEQPTPNLAPRLTFSVCGEAIRLMFFSSSLQEKPHRKQLWKIKLEMVKFKLKIKFKTKIYQVCEKIINLRDKKRKDKYLSITGRRKSIGTKKSSHFFSKPRQVSSELVQVAWIFPRNFVSTGLVRPWRMPIEGVVKN